MTLLTLDMTSSWPICSVSRMISWSVSVERSVLASTTRGGGSEIGEGGMKVSMDDEEAVEGSVEGWSLGA